MPRDTIDLRYEVEHLSIQDEEGSLDEELDTRLDGGADAARFVRSICDLLSDPESFTLAV